MEGSSLGHRTFSGHSKDKNAAWNDSTEIKDSANKDEDDKIVIEKVYGSKNDDKKEENDGRNEYTWLSMLSVVASLPPKQIQKIDFLTNSGGSDESNAVSWIDFNGYEEIKEKIKRIIRGIKKLKDIKKIDTNISHFKNSQIACNSVCGIVLYGPSGCGKTYLSRIIAAEVRIK